MKTLMSLFWCVIGVLFILSPFILIWRLCVMRALRKVTEETPFRVRPLRTSTFQGCGHSYRGWKHFDDGTAEATIWFVLFHLPVFPCEKHRLIVHSDPLDPATAKIGGVPLIHPTITFLDQFEPLTELPVTLAEVLKTYGFAYIFMPLWLFGPLPLLWLHFQYGERVFKSTGGRDDSAKLWNAGFFLLWIMYLCAMLAYQLHNSRGARPKRLIPRHMIQD